MQEFRLPPGQHIHGVLQSNHAMVVQAAPDTAAEENPTEMQPVYIWTQVAAPHAYYRHTVAHRHTDTTTCTAVCVSHLPCPDACLQPCSASWPPFMGQDAIYECAMDMRPEDIFQRLVMGGLERNHAEPLGKTLGLDLLGLYKNVQQACLYVLVS